MTMGPIQNLHYALGQLAYIIATADGAIQKEEMEKFESIMSTELQNKNYDFDISDIIFRLLKKEKTDKETAYHWALKEIKNNSHYLSPEMKNTFIRIMEKMASAYPPVTIEEEEIISRFKKDITPFKGDPLYYERQTT